MSGWARTFVPIALAIALVAAACGDPGTASTSESSDPTSTGVTPETAPTTTRPPVTADEAAIPDGTPSALDFRTHPDFPDPLVDISAIISGGPPPDGIPPIDEPFFVTVAEADGYLADAESVVILDIDGDVRAYPTQVLVWHEIVNDTVGGVPVSVTYCPLCNSAVSYRREVRGEETTFGTSGMLYSSALVMYDRATESLWTHFDGRAVVGVLAGEELEPIGSPLLAWGDFKATYPDGMVLDRDRTGHNRSYGSNPYVSYDNPTARPFLYLGEPDDRTRAMQRVVGVAVGEAALAYSLDALADPSGSSATHTRVGETDVVILWVTGQASALEAGTLDAGRDVGSVGVFLPVLDGEPIDLVAEDGGFVDAATGSGFTVTGEAIDGPLAGSRLERVPHLDTFWFAWSTYRPGTALIEG